MTRFIFTLWKVFTWTTHQPRLSGVGQTTDRLEKSTLNDNDCHIGHRVYNVR